MRPALAALALLLAAPASAAPAAPPTAPAHAAAPPQAVPAHGAASAHPAPAPPTSGALVLYPALGRASQVTVTGRVLAGPASGPATRPAARGLARANVEVTLAGQVRRVVSGADGLFEATFSSPADHPFPIGPGVVQASSGAASAEGAVDLVEDGAPFLLVVEGDDLVGLGAQRGAPGEAEASVSSMAALLGCVVTRTRPAVGAVAVVGGGERAAQVQAALAEAPFPFIGLLVRPAAPRGAGQEAALRTILGTFPQPVVLLGDAGGRAPERFAALRTEFPGRVVAVFVRGSATGAGDHRFDEMTLFTDPLVVARRAAARGLADQACVERALEPPPPEAPALATPPGAAPLGPPPAPAAGPSACPPCPCPVAPPSAPPPAAPAR